MAGGLEYSAADVRREFTYARRLMRLADDAMRAGDVEECGVLACELLGAVSTLAAYCEERGRPC